VVYCLWFVVVPAFDLPANFKPGNIVVYATSFTKDKNKNELATGRGS
jgi:hypothetical protein